MVALKKLFQQERPSTSLGLGSDEPAFDTVESHPQNNLEPGQLSPGHPSPGFPGLRASQSMDVAHHFEQIEKQFEDLHQHLSEGRPLSSQSHLPPSSGRFAVPRLQNSRHIDLLDALFSSRRHKQNTNPQVHPPSSSRYNEDVAERNMTRFLRVQHRNGHASSRILSALYQEDVADRNIAKYGGATRSLSSLSCRSSPPAPGRVRTLSPNGQTRGLARRGQEKPNWKSDDDLRKRSTTPDNASAPSSRSSRTSSLLRQQRSAPSLSAEEKSDAQEDAPPAAVQRLGVPPAYKQGKRWSNTPLPDSPTLPMPMGDGGDNNGSAESPQVPTLKRPPTATARSSSLTSRSLSPPPSSGSASRRNVRDLSINTKLAAKGRRKITHRAIQPPTPSSYEMKRAPSIAQVMNSPLPASSSPVPSPRFKASEMMDLFNKAYMSTQAVSPHPTYETLQDAIVREINSHEAFRRVPVPSASPPFTPSETFGHGSRTARLSRSASAGQLSKIIIRKSSFKKHKRNSESRRSISTSVPSKGYDRILRRVGSSPARRRHTDAPLPSPGLLADIQHSQETDPRPATQEQLTYMDVIFRAGTDKPPSTSGTKNAPAARKRGRSESASNLSTLARSNPDMPHTPGAVYCMQAHSTPSGDSRSSGSHEDSDEDIIHLPNVGAPPPRVQVEGVDENNVRYVIDSTTAYDAQKLMNWPQRARRTNSPQPPTSAAYENSLSLLSRARVQLRGSRSVETC